MESIGSGGDIKGIKSETLESGSNEYDKGTEVRVEEVR